MFNFKKNKPSSSSQPVTVHFLDAQRRAQPIPFTLNSTDLTGLLIEAIQLGKLLATEQRDLEAIRSDYSLKIAYLEKEHNETIRKIDKFYNEREIMIKQLDEQIKRFMDLGQFEIAQALSLKLIDFVADNRPSRSAFDYQNRKLLT